MTADVGPQLVVTVGGVVAERAKPEKEACRRLDEP
jgi:hypothetical protein